MLFLLVEFIITIIKNLLKNIALKHLLVEWQKKEEIFSIFQYLISDKSSYVTGQNFIIDGGYTSN